MCIVYYVHSKSDPAGLQNSLWLFKKYYCMYPFQNKSQESRHSLWKTYHIWSQQQPHPTRTQYDFEFSSSKAREQPTPTQHSMTMKLVALPCHCLNLFIKHGLRLTHVYASTFLYWFQDNARCMCVCLASMAVEFGKNKDNVHSQWRVITTTATAKVWIVYCRQLVIMMNVPTPQQSSAYHDLDDSNMSERPCMIVSLVIVAIT
jgi:hypothetical protein